MKNKFITSSLHFIFIRINQNQQLKRLFQIYNIFHLFEIFEKSSTFIKLIIY